MKRRNESVLRFELTLLLKANWSLTRNVTPFYRRRGVLCNRARHKPTVYCIVVVTFFTVSPNRSTGRFRKKLYLNFCLYCLNISEGRIRARPVCIDVSWRLGECTLKSKLVINYSTTIFGAFNLQIGLKQTEGTFTRSHTSSNKEHSQTTFISRLSYQFSVKHLFCHKSE